MSIAALAQNMARHGRGPDTTLVHMSPKEVNALQALAMANGGSLTLNPKTGLPEAGILDSLLPAVLGFAVNTFLPGAGAAIGGALGASPEVGSALLTGGIRALTGGSTEDVLAAGLGGWGGASIGSALTNAGRNAMVADGTQLGSGILSADKSGALSNAANTDMLARGFQAAKEDPTKFMKDLNVWPAVAAAAPALIKSSRTDNAPEFDSGYIRTMDFDPKTGTFRQIAATRAKDWGGRALAAGGMADGGTAQSQNAYDYLMGKIGTSKAPNLMAIKPTTPPPGAIDGEWVYDPIMQQYKWVEKQKEVAAPAPLLPATPAEQRGGGNDAPAPKTTPDWGTAYALGSRLNDLTGISGLQAAAINGMLGASNEYARAADAAPSTTVGLPQGYDGPGSNQGIGVGQIDPSGGYSGFDPGSASSPGYGGGNDAPGGNADGYGGGDAGFGGGSQPFAYGGAIEPLKIRVGDEGYANGGLANLYAAGGKLLDGPGDGVSDSIPAVIMGHKPQRAALADGEFVIPARIVSELGNGSTKAGARALYAMMDRIQKRRSSTVGKGRVAVDSKASQLLPA